MERNPFRYRASEQAYGEDQFLSLFGPAAIGLLTHEPIWDRLVLFESAPGGGKTTLLRLFTPGVLRRLYRNRATDDDRKLFNRLLDLGALSQEGPSLLGILINCRDQFAEIETRIEDHQTGIRWFFGLMDARVTLMTLRGILNFTGRPFPSGLAEIEFRPKIDEGSHPPEQSLSGDQVFEDARDRESQFASALDSLVGLDPSNDIRRSQLNWLRTLSGADIYVNGQKLVEKVLFMFDDVHELSSNQMLALKQELLGREIKVGRWMASRLDVLPSEEILTSARTEGRDYIQIRIEKWARDHGADFQRLLLDIADRRCRQSNLAIESLSSCLSSKLDNREEVTLVNRAYEHAMEVVKQDTGSVALYDNWVKETEREGDVTPERAIDWRALSILIARHRSKPQMSMDIPLSGSDLPSGRSADVRAAASLFLMAEYQVPYYFGIDNISRMASLNIEQFIELAGDLFEQVILLGALSRGSRPRRLTATEQEAIVRKLSVKRFDSIPRDVPFGQDVQQLVGSIGEYCRE